MHKWPVNVTAGALRLLWNLDVGYTWFVPNLMNAYGRDAVSMICRHLRIAVPKPH